MKVHAGLSHAHNDPIGSPGRRGSVLLLTEVDKGPGPRFHGSGTGTQPAERPRSPRGRGHGGARAHWLCSIWRPSVRRLTDQGRRGPGAWLGSPARPGWPSFSGLSIAGPCPGDTGMVGHELVTQTHGFRMGPLPFPSAPRAPSVEPFSAPALHPTLAPPLPGTPPHELERGPAWPSQQWGGGEEEGGKQP